MRYALRIILATTAIAVLGASAAPALAAGGDYGPNTCLGGFVWREAFAGDTVCVTPATRTQAAADNAAAASRIDPNGAYGSSSCLSPFVWRAARASDLVCVTVPTRTQARADNAAAANRRDSVLASYATYTTGGTTHCDGGTCTNSNDEVTLVRVTVVNVNVGKVALYLFRIGNTTSIWGKSVNATPRAGKPGGIVVFRTPQRVCSPSNTPNSYYRARDLTSGRWSDRKYVTTDCKSL